MFGLLMASQIIELDIIVGGVKEREDPFSPKKENQQQNRGCH